MYYSNKSHRTKACLLHPSKTTRFQARYVKAMLSISEIILATQLEN